MSKYNGLTTQAQLSFTDFTHDIYIFNLVNALDIVVETMAYYEVPNDTND